MRQMSIGTRSYLNLVSVSVANFATRISGPQRANELTRNTRCRAAVMARRPENTRQQARMVRRKPGSDRPRREVQSASNQLNGPIAAGLSHGTASHHSRWYISRPVMRSLEKDGAVWPAVGPPPDAVRRPLGRARRRTEPMKCGGRLRWRRRAAPLPHVWPVSLTEIWNRGQPNLRGPRRLSRSKPMEITPSRSVPALMNNRTSGLCGA